MRMTLRDRAKRLYADLHRGYLSHGNWERLFDQIETELREVRDETLEDAIKTARGRCGMHVDFWDANKQSAARVIEKAIADLKEGPQD